MTRVRKMTKKQMLVRREQTRKMRQMRPMKRNQYAALTGPR